MNREGNESEFANMGENEPVADFLREQFTHSAQSITHSEANRNGVEVSGPVRDYVADLAFRYTEGLAKDFELFARHAGRKTVRTQDVIIAAHRNEHLDSLLRSFSINIKATEPRSERKRRRSARKERSAAMTSVSSPFNGMTSTEHTEN